VETYAKGRRDRGGFAIDQLIIRVERTEIRRRQASRRCLETILGGEAEFMCLRVDKVAKEEKSQQVG